MTKSSPVTGYLSLLVKSVGLVLDKVNIRFEEAFVHSAAGLLFCLKRSPHRDVLSVVCLGISDGGGMCAPADISSSACHFL